MSSWKSLGAACLVILGMSGTDAAVRGRVKIINNTLVSDDGKMLRGWHIGDAWKSHPQSVASWREGDALGLNVARVDGNKPLIDERDGSPEGEPNTEAHFQKVDKAVQAAADAGKYCLLLYGGVGRCEPGHLKEFWQKCAPRYNDRTHVIYEIKNEPNWGGTGGTATQCEVYKSVRELAPNTHIVTFSNPALVSVAAVKTFEQDYKTRTGSTWSWANSTVGYHLYGGSEAGAVELKKTYPSFMTEGPESLGWMKWIERAGIAWVMFRGKSGLDVADVSADLKRMGVSLTWMGPTGVGLSNSIAADLAGSAARHSLCIMHTPAFNARPFAAYDLTGRHLRSSGMQAEIGPLIMSRR